MLDKNIAKRDLQFKLDIKSQCLKYVGQLFSKNVLFSVDIPYPILKLWHHMVKNRVMQELVHHQELQSEQKATLIYSRKLYQLACSCSEIPQGKRIMNLSAKFVVLKVHYLRR
jgi:hypothetical protein